MADIPTKDWDGIFNSDNPFIRHAFLLALEESACVGEGTGWQPLHLLLFDNERPVAAMPLYAKMHSYGEFVFDWGWAQAYARHELDYYPKLVSAVPFSPVTGPRIGVATGTDAVEAFRCLLGAVRKLADGGAYSSWHLLFPDRGGIQVVEESKEGSELLHREAVQFHWFNRNYNSFEDFLAGLRSSRRKNLKRERRKVSEQGVRVQRKTGAQISDEEWLGFYHCYINTYRKRSGHDGYLNLDFFDRLRDCLADNLMLAVASKGDEIVASSLFMYDSTSLYGRYWGALEDVSCLHFETCFYQGIEFCIEHGLQQFDPGTQGEHKLMRGFEPLRTVSCHWIADARFRSAIEDFLKLEHQDLENYQRQAEDFLPYRKDGL